MSLFSRGLSVRVFSDRSFLAKCGRAAFHEVVQ
jgi:hypothetical protein